MKPEEALEILELPKDPLKSWTHYHAIPSPKRISYSDYLNARKAAVEALEKQMPKKPDNLCGYSCRACSGRLARQTDLVNQKFCHHCGQKINWED